MRALLTTFGLLYAMSAIVLVPILINVSWDIAFPPLYLDRSAAIYGAFKIAAWLIGGYLLLKYWAAAERMVLTSKVKTVASKNFKASFELYGFGLNEYIGMAPAENEMVIVDLKRGVVRRESMDFYQGWSIEEEGIYTFLTIRFNSFDYPSMKFQIPTKGKGDIIAKLNYAMQF